MKYEDFATVNMYTYVLLYFTLITYSILCGFFMPQVLNSYENKKFSEICYELFQHKNQILFLSVRNKWVFLRLSYLHLFQMYGSVFSKLLYNKDSEFVYWHIFTD